MKKAFSLVELLVVMAIVGILSAIAVPMYKQYTIKAKIGANVSLLYSLLTEIKKARNQQFNATSLTFMGQTLNGSGSWGNITAPSVQKFYYYNSFSGGNIIFDGVCIYMYGLEGIPGYSQPVNGQDGTYTRLCAHNMYGSNGVDRVTCGRWIDTNNTLDIPLEYLPAGCSCPSLSSGTC